MSLPEDPIPKDSEGRRQKFVVVFILVAAVLCASLSAYAILFHYR